MLALLRRDLVLAVRAGGGFGRHPSGANLPKITKPFNTASSAGGVPALTQEEARALYGMNVPPESEL